MQQSEPATTQYAYLQSPPLTANEQAPIQALHFQLKGDHVKDFLFFDKMITPKIITFVYWFILFFAVLAGLNTMFKGYEGITFEKFLLGLLVIVGVGVGARIYAELLIVLFKINENTKKIADKS